MLLSFAASSALDASFSKYCRLSFLQLLFDFFVFLSILSCKSLLQALRGCSQHSFLSFSSPRNFCPSCFANPLFSPFLLISQDLFAGFPQNTVKFIDCHLGFVVKCVELVCEFQCKLSLNLGFWKLATIKASSSGFTCSDFPQFQLHFCY